MRDNFAKKDMHPLQRRFDATFSILTDRLSRPRTFKKKLYFHGTYALLLKLSLILLKRISHSPFQLIAHFSLPFRVAPGLPDTRTCLLHQKLQMLNVCIEKRLQRERGIAAKTEGGMAMHTAGLFTDDDDDDEEDDDTNEEFYDLTEEDSDDPTEVAKQKEDNSKNPLKAEGRLRRFKNLKLIGSDEYLYVPVTQDLAPKTEDQLQDASDVMLKMGSDSGKAFIRLKKIITNK